MPNTVLWLRRDLRLADHPALKAAHTESDGGRVLPLFVLDHRLWDGAGAARRAWLCASLESLQARYDGALVVRSGPPAAVVAQVAREVGSPSVHVTAESTPFGRRRDAAVRAALEGDGRRLEATGTAYAVGPGTVLNGSGAPFQVFTPFSRAWRRHGWPAPAKIPRKLRFLGSVESEELPEAGDAEDVPRLPRSGEPAALEHWHDFLDAGLRRYDQDRDRPDLDGTSQMSAHLRYGEIHPRTLLADIAAHPETRKKGAERYVTELCWREFYADVLWHRPDSAWHDLKPALATMVYDEPGERFEAWKRGRTGYPVVDAGMRQIASQGWMHNRMRMITASFLVKDLHVHWSHGARHFLSLLRDGDVASNSHGWQWVAGTGTDASPYFRIFNPVTQGTKFDPGGDYVRRYVRELQHLPGASAHEPWKVPGGYDGAYPQPIVDHAVERAEALRRYEAARA